MLIRVSHKQAFMRDQLIAGPTGQMYKVHPVTGELHAFDGTKASATSGCAIEDAREFKAFGTFMVLGPVPPPAPPPAPGEPSGSGGSPDSSAEAAEASPGASPWDQLMALDREVLERLALQNAIPSDLDDESLVAAILMARGVSEAKATGAIPWDALEPGDEPELEPEAPEPVAEEPKPVAPPPPPPAPPAAPVKPPVEPEPPAEDSAPAYTRQGLMDLTQKKQRGIAKELKIKGYSRMREAALVDAIMTATE